MASKRKPWRRQKVVQESRRQLWINDPAAVKRLPGSETGTCFAVAHSPIALVSAVSVVVIVIATVRIVAAHADEPRRDIRRTDALVSRQLRIRAHWRCATGREVLSHARV